MKKNGQLNLVHGSDHGGNKSQAVLPGGNGEGSIANLKQVDGMGKNTSLSNKNEKNFLTSKENKMLQKKNNGYPCMDHKKRNYTCIQTSPRLYRRGKRGW